MKNKNTIHEQYQEMIDHLKQEGQDRLTTRLREEQWKMNSASNIYNRMKHLSMIQSFERAIKELEDEPLILGHA